MDCQNDLRYNETLRISMREINIGNPVNAVAIKEEHFEWYLKILWLKVARAF